MWPLYQPIRTPEILKCCEISWDFPKKYFHLKSNACVYNSFGINIMLYPSMQWKPHSYILSVPEHKFKSMLK